MTDFRASLSAIAAIVDKRGCDWILRFGSKADIPPFIRSLRQRGQALAADL
jgi:hypothetical protein